MEAASSNCALRVCRDVALSSLSVVRKGATNNEENDGEGGSCTRDNAICHSAFLLSGLRWAGVFGFGLRLEQEAELAAVVATFARWFPRDGSKGALEEGVVDDVAFVILAFDDPVTRVSFALSGVGEDEGGVEALRSVD